MQATAAMEAFRRCRRKAGTVYRSLYYGPLRCTPIFRIPRYLSPAMMHDPIICESARLIYYPVPKTGSTTIKSMLLEIENHPVPEDDDAVHEPSTGLRRAGRFDIRGPRFEDYFRFAFVRNPWARLVSCYCNKVLAPRPQVPAFFARQYPRVPFHRMSFTDFVRFACRVPDELCDQHFRPQSHFLDFRNTNFIGRFEHFSDDLGRIIEAAGLPENLHRWRTMRRMRSSVEGQRYVDFYSAETRRLVAGKFENDIERFSYRFGD